MRVIKIPAGETQTVTQDGWLPNNLQNVGPGVAIVEGDVLAPGQFWTPRVHGQRSFVVTTVDQETTVGVN